MRLISLTILAFALAFQAQANELDQEVLAHLAVYPSYEINPTLSFALVVPQDLAAEPTDSLTMSLNSGNSFNPNVEAPAFNKDCSFSYDVDTVADRIDLQWKKKLSEFFGMDVSVGAYSPNGTSQIHPLGYFASDSFIEDFHSQIGREDPFGRKEIGFDRSVVSIKDCNGRELELERGDIYLLPIRVGTTYYRDIISKKNHRLSYNVGAHIAIPLSSASRSASGAISVNLINTIRVTDKIDWTLAAGGAYSRDIYTVHENTARVQENKWHNDTYITTGFVYKKSNGVKYMLGASMHGKSRLLKEGYYDFTGVDQHARRALSGPNDYIEVFVSRETKNWVVQLGFREDYRMFSRPFEVGNDNHGGSNSEDVGVNFNVTRKFGKR